MDVLWTAAGALLIALTLGDIFATLFHPLGRGYVERSVLGGVSRLGRRLAAHVRSAPVLVGPLGYISAVVSWAALLTVGWALIFFPHLPDGFVFGEGLNPGQHDDFVDAL